MRSVHPQTLTAADPPFVVAVVGLARARVAVLRNVPDVVGHCAEVEGGIGVVPLFVGNDSLVIFLLRPDGRAVLEFTCIA